jgi:hypothetical protein
MSSPKVKIDRTEIRKMLQSQEMLEMVKQAAAGKTDSEHHTKPFIGFDRAKVFVYPNTKEHPS